MLKLAGGAEKLLAQAQTALQEGDYPWAAQLATYLLTVEQQTAAAKQVKIAAYKAVAANTHSSNERYYMLSGVRWLEEGAPYLAPLIASGNTDMVPTSEFVELLGSKLDLKQSAEMLLTVNINVSDTKEHFRLTVRRGVLARREGQHDEPDLTLTTDRANLLAFVVGWESGENLIKTEKIHAKGNAQQFLSLFD